MTAPYSIHFKRSVQKDLSKIPTRDLHRILARIERLAEIPRPPDCTKLPGPNQVALYRVRQGRYRIVYTIEDNQLQIWVITVAHRKKVYR